MALVAQSALALSSATDPGDVKGKLDIRSVTLTKDSSGAPLEVKVKTWETWPKKILRRSSPNRLRVLVDTDRDGETDFKGRVVMASGSLSLDFVGTSLESLSVDRPDAKTVVVTIPGESPANPSGALQVAARSRYRDADKGCVPPCVDRSPDAGWVLISPTGGGGGEKFTCTQAIGFSQTRQWYLDAPDFETTVGSNEWQLLWHGGAAVQRWADPDYVGWSEPLESPCQEGSTAPDRVVLTISGDFQSDPAVWASDIEAAVNTIRGKYPDLDQIVLQPVVGGPDHEACEADGGTVRASFNHPFIDQGIALVVGGDIVAGASPEVRSCNDYADAKGHLVVSARGPIGESIGQFYAAA